MSEAEKVRSGEREVIRVYISRGRGEIREEDMDQRYDYDPIT